MSSDIDQEFWRLTHPGPGQKPNRGAIVRFLNDDRVVKRALRLGFEEARRTRNAADRDDRASELAYHAVKTVQRHVKAGEVIKKSLEGYVRTIMRGKMRDFRRVKIPAGVVPADLRKKHGLYVHELFQKVRVQNLPLGEAVKELVNNNPHDEKEIHEAAEVIRETDRWPSDLPEKVQEEHNIILSEDPETEYSAAARRSDVGCRSPSLVDAVLRAMTKEEALRVVRKLPMPFRDYAQAVYVDRTVWSAGELNDRFRINNGRDLIDRKLPELIVQALLQRLTST